MEIPHLQFGAHRLEGATTGFLSPLGKRNLRSMFSLLAVSNRGILSKASILRAIHNDHRVIELLHSSASLRPLLTPKNYAEQFQKMNTSNTGLVSTSEFADFVGTLDRQDGYGLDDSATIENADDPTVRVIFDRLDLNHDGDVSKREILKALRTDDELVEILSNHRKLSILLKPKHWEEAFNNMDTSQDGFVNFIEFQAFSTLLSEKAGREEQAMHADLKRIFYMFDKDGNGLLTKREIMSGLRDDAAITTVRQHPKLAILLKPRKWKAAFDAMDTSRDGKVELNEFIAFATVLSEHAEGSPAGDGPGGKRGLVEPEVDMRQALQNELGRICNEKISDAFVKRDELLLDLLQGMAALQTTAGIPLTGKLKAGGETPAYPKRLVNTARETGNARRKRHAELMNEPYVPIVRKSATWSVNLRPETSSPLMVMMKLDPEMRCGPGTSNIYEGRIKEKHRLKDANETQRDRRLYIIKVKHGVFIDLLTVMRHGKKEFPKLPLPQALSEGKLKAEYTELNNEDFCNTTVQIDKFLLQPLREHPKTPKLLRRIKREGSKPLRDIFMDIVGNEFLKEARTWFRISGRVKCCVQFQFPPTTVLRRRAPPQVDADTFAATQRIKTFRKNNPCDNGVGIPFITYPSYSVMKQDDAIVAAERSNESYEGRVYARMKRNATRRMRHEWIPKEWDLVLTGYDPSRKRVLMKKLKEWLRIDSKAAKYTLRLCDQHGPKEGKLLKADMGAKECEKMKTLLEECGAVCRIEKENWGNFSDLSEPEGDDED